MLDNELIGKNLITNEVSINFYLLGASMMNEQ